MATTALTKATIAHDPLAKAVAGINVSDTAKGMLPLSACKLTNSTTVTCTQPTPAVDVVIFRTYSSSQALYAAYEARVSAIAREPFKSNYGNCTETRTNGEVGWNHNFQHPTIYPMSEFTLGADHRRQGRRPRLLHVQRLGSVPRVDPGRRPCDGRAERRPARRCVRLVAAGPPLGRDAGLAEHDDEHDRTDRDHELDEHSTSTMSTATTTSTMNMPSTKGMTSTTSTSMH